MDITKVPPLTCHECNSERVSQRRIRLGKKITNTILSCFDCRKDYSMKDGESTEHKNRPFYGKSGTVVSRYEMGDYADNLGN